MSTREQVVVWHDQAPALGAAALQSAIAKPLTLSSNTRSRAVRGVCACFCTGICCIGTSYRYRRDSSWVLLCCEHSVNTALSVCSTVTLLR